MIGRRRRCRRLLFAAGRTVLLASALAVGCYAFLLLVSVGRPAIDHRTVGRGAKLSRNAIAPANTNARNETDDAEQPPQPGVNQTVTSADRRVVNKAATSREHAGAQKAHKAKVSEQADEIEAQPQHRDNQGDATSSLIKAIESDLDKPVKLNRPKLADVKVAPKSKWVKDDVDSGQNGLPLCDEKPPTLTGRMKQAVLLIPGLKESEVLRNHRELHPGGAWRPTHCKARNKVAIIIPFRDRQSHLCRLLDYLIPMLQRQQLDFRFIVTEQYGRDLFNKGRIMNAAFELAESLGVECVVFHDVDMFPQDDRNSYGCPATPRHIGAFVNLLGYQLWYKEIAGGVLAMRTDQYRQLNGYSNSFWAWGGEDDDMGARILAQNLTIERRFDLGAQAHFTMLKHVKRQRTAPSLVYKLLATAGSRWPTDGLNNTEWRVIKITRRPLYYHMYVDVGTPPDEWRGEKKKA